jgi:hypothetical protein
VKRLPLTIRLSGREIARQIRLSAPAVERIDLGETTMIDAPASDTPGVALTALRGVELVGVGYKTPSINGAATITERDLVDAAEAANSKHFNTPRVGLGHVDTSAKDFADGLPSFGRFTNVRVSEDRQTLLGDLEGVPVWVAEVLPAAYPSRSIRGRHNVEAGSKTYSTVIDRVDLLGITLPACKSIADLSFLSGEWYGEKPPEGVAFSDDVSKRLRDVKLAEVDTCVIDRAFYYEFCNGKYADWWMKGERVDDQGNIRIIAEGEQGALYSVPVSVGGDGEVSFGDPTPVIEQYVAASEAPTGELILAAYTSRDESRANLREELVYPTKVRLALGLAEDASDADVEAKLDEQAEERAKAAQQVQEDQQKPPEAPAKPESQLSDSDAVKIDRRSYELLMSTAKTVAEIERREKEKERDTLLSECVNAGRITRARREHYAARYDSDPDGTRELLMSFPEGSALPVGEPIGASNLTEDAEQSYSPSMLTPVEQARLSARAEREKSGTRDLVVFSSSEV